MPTRTPCKPLLHGGALVEASDLLSRDMWGLKPCTGVRAWQGVQACYYMLAFNVLFEALLLNLSSKQQQQRKKNL